ncbi:ImcF-related family protein [Inquilinus sp. NPDC058860]|uniref:ImcF-related family protein n=1 Tax=Inquilinus sp. NPDC058860 TaxID=3346652 RepID=UPI0036C85F54
MGRTHGAASIAAGLLVLAVAALMAIHLSNAHRIGLAESSLATARSLTPAADAASDDPAAALPALDALAASPVASGPGAAPWWRALVPNGGRLRRVAEATADHDRTLLGDAFLRRLGLRILRRIDRPDVDPELAFDGLKAALGIAGAGRRQDQLIRLWAAVDWALALPADEQAATRAALGRQLDRALAAEPRLAPRLDDGAVARIRTRLRREPLSARAYAAIRTSDAAQALPAFRADLALGPDGWPVRRRSGMSLATPIPGLLTADGFRTVLVPALGNVSASIAADAWVLGDAAEPETTGGGLVREVLDRYLDDLARAWDPLLGDLELSPQTSDPDASARIVEALTRSPGPLLRFVIAARHATLLDRPSDPAAAARLDALAERLGGARPWASIDRRYSWLETLGQQPALPGFDALTEAARPFIDRAGSLPTGTAGPAPALD